mgnify:FL=1
MNFSNRADTRAHATRERADAVTVLAREAGIPFQPPMDNASGVDPIAEWLSLMEVVQMLCPVWIARDTPMLGDHWRL